MKLKTGETNLPDRGQNSGDPWDAGTGRKQERASWNSRKVLYLELCNGSLGLCSLLKMCALDEMLIILQFKKKTFFKIVFASDPVSDSAGVHTPLVPTDLVSLAQASFPPVPGSMMLFNYPGPGKTTFKTGQQPRILNCFLA